MIILKIALQIAIGIAALLTVYLDYKWWDKRKAKFKIGRNWLIGIMVFILTSSIITTFYDENEQEEKKAKLNAELSDMKDSLSVIKKIGVDLNKQIEPILNLAKEKYPELSIEEAIKKLQIEIDKIESTTSQLEEKDRLRKDAENRLEKLRKTPPDVNFELGFEGNNLIIYVQFNNQVPIVVSPWLFYYGPWECEDNTKIYGIFNTAKFVQSPPKIYPPANMDEKQKIVFDSISEGERLPFDKDLCIRMSVTYSSVYAEEAGIPELKNNEVILDYVIEANTKRFVKTKFSKGK